MKRFVLLFVCAVIGFSASSLFGQVPVQAVSVEPARVVVSNAVDNAVVTTRVVAQRTRSVVRGTLNRARCGVRRLVRGC